jgi:cephalosporin hydroxylase
LNSNVNDWLVVGIDKNDLTRERQMIGEWSFGDHVRLVEGSSTDEVVLAQVKKLARDHESCLVFLDSDHSESHVARELESYSKFVSVGSYLVVFDSGIGRLSDETHAIRPRGWNKSSHAGVAVGKFVESQNRISQESATSQRFEVDTSFAEPLGISSIEGGVLRRVL